MRWLYSEARYYARSVWFFLFAFSMLGLFNRYFVQWFCIRLAKSSHEDRTTTWHILRWVWPLTGWDSDYRWIKKVWPPLMLDNCHACGRSETVGYHDDCKIDHYIIVRSDGSQQLEWEIADEVGNPRDPMVRGQVTFTLGADKNRANLMQCCRSYDPEGVHYVCMELTYSTWGEAKVFQTLLREQFYNRYSEGAKVNHANL